MKIALVGLSSLLAAGLLFAADPFVGTWKHNLDKSKFSKKPSENFAILKWESVGKDHYRLTRYRPDGIRAEGTDGKPDPQGDFIVDGKEHQVTDYTRIATRIGATHFKFVEKGNGVELGEFSVSADGNTLTLVRKGTNIHSRRPLDEVWVYERQQGATQ